MVSWRLQPFSQWLMIGGRFFRDGFLNLENFDTKDLDVLTPRKMNGWNPQNHPSLKSGKSSEPNHHFQLPAVNLPGCTDWPFPKRKRRNRFESADPQFLRGKWGKVAGSDSMSFFSINHASAWEPLLGRQGVQ